MDLSDSELRSAVAKLILDDPDFIDLEQRLNLFCPFEAMGVVRAEIRHAFFLAHILDPNGPHGFGTAFLRHFLFKLAEECDYGALNRLTLHIADLESTEVRRELDRMDLVLILHSLKIAIIIELKVESDEGRDQLARYRMKAYELWPRKQGWAHQFIFLTPNGRGASDEINWKSVSYEVIASAGSSVLAGYAGTGGARDLLGAYIAMIRRRHMGDETLITLARDLWKRHQAALTFLLEQQPNAVGFAQYIIDNIRNLMESTSVDHITLVEDRLIPNYINFGVAEWDSLPGIQSGKGWTKSGRMLLFEINVCPNFIDLKFILGPGPDQFRGELFQAIASVVTNRVRNTPKYTLFSKVRINKEVGGMSEDESRAFFDEFKLDLKSFVHRTVMQLDSAVREVALKSDLT